MRVRAALFALVAIFSLVSAVFVAGCTYVVDDGGGEAVPLRVSAKTGEGLEALRQRITERLAAWTAKGTEETGDVTARQASQLETAAQALAGVDVGDPVLAANALRQAAEAIGRIVGKTYSDDLLDELFSRFCVGK